jgi:hypothetical protein
MFSDISLATICVILVPAPSVLQAGTSDACVCIRGSIRRTSGSVLTGNSEVTVVTRLHLSGIADPGDAGTIPPAKGDPMSRGTQPQGSSVRQFQNFQKIMCKYECARKTADSDARQEIPAIRIRVRPA